MKGKQILYIVLAVTIILLIAIAYDSRRSVPVEGFAMNGCPKFIKPATLIYTGKKSGKICCYGTVENGKCVGKGFDRKGTNQCMIGKKQDDIPECNEFVNNITNKIKEVFCPKSMQNVFFNGSGIGCTDGPLNATEDAPMHSSSKKCLLPLNEKGFDENDINTNPDNCINQIVLENMVCPTSRCNKFIRPAPGNKRMIRGMDFISPDGIPVTCYDNFGGISEVPFEKSNGYYNNHPMSCSVAKRLYVDKSMRPADVKLLP